MAPVAPRLRPTEEANADETSPKGERTVTTPPPSTTSSVGPPEGYTADTDSMSSQATAINDGAEDAQNDVKDLKPTKVGEADFGTKHTQWHKDYAAGIDKLGAGAEAMCTNLIAFAGQIGSAGKTYSAAEESQASAATESGSGM